MEVQRYVELVTGGVVPFLGPNQLKRVGRSGISA